MSKASEALDRARELNADVEGEPDPTTEWVEMTHPGVHDEKDKNVHPARATREAFNTVWEPRGWVLHKAGDTTATAPATGSVVTTP